MFDKKSEYALNKYDQDSIIYISVSGRIRLTRADFSSEEEFLKWKAWSDADYHQTEKEGRSFNDNRVALDDYLDVVGAVQSAEDEFFSKLIEGGFAGRKESSDGAAAGCTQEHFERQAVPAYLDVLCRGKVRYGDCKARRSNESQHFSLP